MWSLAYPQTNCVACDMFRFEYPVVQVSECLICEATNVCGANCGMTYVNWSRFVINYELAWRTHKIQTSISVSDR